MYFTTAVQLMPDEFKAVLAGLFELSRGRFTSSRDTGGADPAPEPGGNTPAGVTGEGVPGETAGGAEKSNEHDEVKNKNYNNS